MIVETNRLILRQWCEDDADNENVPRKEQVIDLNGGTI